MQQCRVDTLSDQSESPKLNEMLRQSSKGPWSMWELYLQPTTLAETLELLKQQVGQARIVSGGTDVLVELQRGIKPTSTLIDISRLHDLKYIRLQDGQLCLGALATHNDVVASQDCIRFA